MNSENNHYFQSMYDSLKTQYQNLEMLHTETKIKLNNIE